MPVGLTITAANHVIHLERHWNPAKQAPATDRVIRIGQTRDVLVHVTIRIHPERASYDVNPDKLLVVGIWFLGFAEEGELVSVGGLAEPVTLSGSFCRNHPLLAEIT